MKKRDTEPLLQDYFYHVFARTNNRERLFVSDENYRFFLRRYTDFLLPIAKTYAYALLENHVHFLIKMRDEQTLATFCETTNQGRTRSDAFLESDDPYTPIKPETVASYQFQRFFTSYAKAFNKQQSRYGNLIQRPFKRKMIKMSRICFSCFTSSTIRKSMATTDFRSYKWSSYQSFLSDAPTKIERAELLDWFGGRDYFLAFHDQSLDDQSWEFE